MDALDFFSEGLATIKSSERVLQKNDRNKKCRKTYDLQTSFCSCFAQNLPKEAKDLARDRLKVSMRCKLRGFNDTSDYVNLLKKQENFPFQY
jgi:hypothetical protein